MNLKSNFKKRVGLVVSILFHLLFLLGAIHTLSHDRYRPTSTMGYQVELVHTQDKTQPATPATSVTPVASQEDIAAAQAKAEVNLKKAVAAKKAHQLTTAKRQAEIKQRQEERQQSQKAAAIKQALAKSQAQTPQSAGEINKPVAPTAPKPVPTHQGVTMTNKNQEQIVASAPTGSPDTIGDGGETNSSTDGTGTQSGAFDFRVIEYGRDAADAIEENIVVPKAYAYTHITYRAFVVLDKNMQYQSMKLVKSTGNAEYDANIAKALQQTIYPPLPSGADWNIFHNIDFTIK